MVVKSALTAVTRLRDVAMGADAYTLRSLLNGEAAPALQIIQSPGANTVTYLTRFALQNGWLRRAARDIEYRIAYDPTVFGSASSTIGGGGDYVAKTLVLVVLVVVLFPANGGRPLFTLVAVPVSLVGTFALMHLFGFSLNTAFAVWFGPVDRYRCG